MEKRVLEQVISFIIISWRKRWQKYRLMHFKLLIEQTRRPRTRCELTHRLTSAINSERGDVHSSDCKPFHCRCHGNVMCFKRAIMMQIIIKRANIMRYYRHFPLLSNQRHTYTRQRNTNSTKKPIKWADKNPTMNHVLNLRENTSCTIHLDDANKRQVNEREVEVEERNRKKNPGKQLKIVCIFNFHIIRLRECVGVREKMKHQPQPFGSKWNGLIENFVLPPHIHPNVRSLSSGLRKQKMLFRIW